LNKKRHVALFIPHSCSELGVKERDPRTSFAAVNEAPTSAAYGA